ncbi:MAG: hypothetical protein WAW80_03340 [Candidatus Saccharimonadales bacterium]
MTISRESDIPFPRIIVDDLVKYAGEVPLTPGTFAPLPLIDDEEASRAPFDHERMYESALSTYAFRGMSFDSSHGSPGAFTFMSSVLVSQAKEQVTEHINTEKQRNQAAVVAALRLLDRAPDITDNLAEMIDRLADGNATVLDKAILVSTFPDDFPSLELMNCRRFYDETAMRNADTVATANIELLLEEGFSTAPLYTKESKDAPAGYGLKTRSKKALTRITLPNGVPLIESRWTIEAIVPIETGEAYILPELKSQYLYVCPKVT